MRHRRKGAGTPLGMSLPKSRIMRTNVKGVKQLENTPNVPVAAIDAEEAAGPMMGQQTQVVAMAYVPVQQFGTVFEPTEGFQRGTMFPELYKPWLGGRFND